MEAEQKQSGCLKKAGYGCLGVFILGAVACALLYVNREKIAVSVTAATIDKVTEGMASTMLPEAEREAVLEPIRQLTDDLRQGKVKLGELEAVGTELAKPDVMAAVGVPVFEKTYLNPSDLDAAEKEAGALSLRRFAKGVADGKISGAEAQDAIESFSDGSQKIHGGRQVPKLKDKVSSEELRECLKKMQALADKAKIPNKRFDVDPGAKVRQAIERGLGRGAAAEGDK